MAKTDWAALQAEFALAHAATGISAQAWCEAKGLNYQSARRYIKPSAAQKAAQECATAQSGVRTAQTAQNEAGKVQAGWEEEEGEQERSSSSTQAQTDLAQSVSNNGRDQKGRFAKGNPGNPNPPANIKPGMQLTKTHGGYAKFLDADELFDEAEELRLRDELVFTRARVISVTKTLKSLQQDLTLASEMADRIALYDKILKAEQALDRNIQRIESIERSLRAIKVDEARVPHIMEDTKRVQAATRKLTAEADRLETESGGDTTALGEVVEELQGDGTGGLMS